MAIKNVWINKGCIACGLSEGICPEVFKLEDKETIINSINFSDYDMKIREAAENCPVGVIQYSE